MTTQEIELITNMLSNMTEGATTAFIVYMSAYVLKPTLMAVTILFGLYKTVAYVVNAMKEDALATEKRRLEEARSNTTKYKANIEESKMRQAQYEMVGRTETKSMRQAK